MLARLLTDGRELLEDIHTCIYLSFFSIFHFSFQVFWGSTFWQIDQNYWRITHTSFILYPVDFKGKFQCANQQCVARPEQDRIWDFLRDRIWDFLRFFRPNFQKNWTQYFEEKKEKSFETENYRDKSTFSFWQESLEDISVGSTNKSLWGNPRELL